MGELVPPPTLLCSVLLPSRGRVAGLRKAVESIFRAVSQPLRVEVIIRVDNDDEESIIAARCLEARWSPEWPIRVVVGSRILGWKTLNLLYTEMAFLAKGQWLWIFNDDCYVESGTWDDRLAEIPTTGFIVQAQGDRNGQSLYEFHEGGPFPLVPNQSWYTYERQAIGDPADIWLDYVLRKQMGWATRFLDGVIVHHERASDPELQEHRRL